MSQYIHRICEGEVMQGQEVRALMYRSYQTKSEIYIAKWLLNENIAGSGNQAMYSIVKRQSEMEQRELSSTSIFNWSQRICKTFNSIESRQNNQYKTL